MASTLCCLVVLLCLLVLGRAQVPYSYCMHFAKCFGARSVPLSRLGSFFVLQKGRLVCKSGCHGCPALHRRTGPLAPHDNHSLAEGHRLCSYLASIHLLCCWRAHESLAPRTRNLLGGLGQATLNFVAVATLLFFSFCECPKFCDLTKERRKFFFGVSEVGKIHFALFFSGGASFPWFSIFFCLFVCSVWRRSLPSSVAAARISQTSLCIWCTSWSVVGRGYASSGLRPARQKTLWMAWYPQLRECCGSGGGGPSACLGLPQFVCGRWGWPHSRARSPLMARGAASIGPGRAWPVPGGSPPALRSFGPGRGLRVCPPAGRRP